MLGVNGRGVARIIFTPIAKVFHKIGITPDFVTVSGAVFSALVSILLLAKGKIVLSVILLTLLSFFDSIDGTLARMSGKVSRWGAFLDATCDRFSDFFILFGLTIYCYNINQMYGALICILCMPVFFAISYTRAKAESLGFKGDGGLLERSDRLIFLALVMLPVGFGVSFVYFNVLMLLLFIGCILTIIERVGKVFHQDRKGVKLDFSTQRNAPEDNIKRK